jgi:FAD:protein FMN transferase
MTGTAPLIAPTADPIAGVREVTFAARAMGSPLRLTVIPEGPVDRDAAVAAWQEVVSEFESSEQTMSRFRETSEITGLNRRCASGDRWTVVSPRLRRALIASDRAHRVTGGRFDPRVIVDLERLGDTGAPIGDDPALLADQRKSTSRIVERRVTGDVRLPAPVDLGGIGKGLALRWAAAAVAGAGIAAFLVEAGGDIVAVGSPPDSAWHVGIEDPRGGSGPLAVIAARDTAVATSSVMVRRWVAGGRSVHHLIDPQTGEPGGPGLLAVTVAGHDAAWSEVWSKALFLEGRAEIATVARARGLAAWWVTEDGAMEMTAAARVRTVWTAEHSR